MTGVQQGGSDLGLGAEWPCPGPRLLNPLPLCPPGDPKVAQLRCAPGSAAPKPGSPATCGPQASLLRPEKPAPQKACLGPRHFRPPPRVAAPYAAGLGMRLGPQWPGCSPALSELRPQRPWHPGPTPIKGSILLGGPGCPDLILLGRGLAPRAVTATQGPLPNGGSGLGPSLTPGWLGSCPCPLRLTTELSFSISAISVATLPLTLAFMHEGPWWGWA